MIHRFAIAFLLILSPAAVADLVLNVDTITKTAFLTGSDRGVPEQFFGNMQWRGTSPVSYMPTGGTTFANKDVFDFNSVTGSGAATFPDGANILAGGGSDVGLQLSVGPNFDPPYLGGTIVTDPSERFDYSTLVLGEQLVLEGAHGIELLPIVGFGFSPARVVVVPEPSAALTLALLLTAIGAVRRLVR